MFIVQNQINESENSCVYLKLFNCNTIRVRKCVRWYKNKITYVFLVSYLVNHVTVA